MMLKLLVETKNGFENESEDTVAFRRVFAKSVANKL